MIPEKGDEYHKLQVVLLVAVLVLITREVWWANNAQLEGASLKWPLELQVASLMRGRVWVAWASLSRGQTGYACWLVLVPVQVTRQRREKRRRPE